MFAPLSRDDPRRIGPYRLQGRLGSGGMGVVYLGFTAADRPVAVKVATAPLAADGEFRLRFAREVAAASRVRGGSVAGVLAADTTADRPWMATEYVDGVSLAEAVAARGPLDERLVRGIAVGLADGLVAIHDAGVVHRDLKPSNVLLAWDGPKVIDFGVARLAEVSGVTRTGFVVGTVAWMAPEQLRGEPVTPAADIFSWGMCVAYAATGRHPFGEGTGPELAGRVMTGPADLTGLVPDLAGLVAAALDKDPGRRPTAAELVGRLVGRPVAGLAQTAVATTGYLAGIWAPPARGYGPPHAPRAPVHPHARPALRRRNTLAVVSLVLGVVWLWGVGSVLAIVFGRMAQRQIRVSGDRGGWLARAGAALGWVGLVLTVLAALAARSHNVT